MSEPDKDVPELFLQISRTFGKTKNGHDFRGRGDIKAGFPWYAGQSPSETNNDSSEGSIIHVHHPLPMYCARINPQIEFLVLDVVVDKSRKQVVRFLNRSEISREMEEQIASCKIRWRGSVWRIANVGGVSNSGRCGFPGRD